MLHAIDPEAVTEIQTPEDSGPTKSTFLIKTLSGRQYARVISKMETRGASRAFTSAAIEEAVRQGLVGWKDFPAAWDDDIERNIDALPSEAFMHVASEIIKLAELGNAARGN